MLIVGGTRSVVFHTSTHTPSAVKPRVNTRIRCSVSRPHRVGCIDEGSGSEANPRTPTSLGEMSGAKGVFEGGRVAVGRRFSSAMNGQAR